MRRKLSMEELGRLEVESFRVAEKFPLILVLDDIRSMHNVGSVLRSADAFGIEAVWMGGFTPTPPHREIQKTALGAEESVNWRKSDNLQQDLLGLKSAGYTLLAIEQTTDSVLLPAFQPPVGPMAVILGNEVTGVSDELLEVADAVLEIPQYGTKHSLNVAVAAGIVLYALARR